MAKVNKKYCNGCIYSEWKAGVEKEITDKLRQEAHPYPMHSCKKLGVKRLRNNFKIDRIDECVERKLADYSGAM